MNHSGALSETIALMRWIVLAAAVSSVLAPALFASGQSLSAAHITNAVLLLPDGGEITYGISVPDNARGAGQDSSRGDSVPLILALHPGGARTAYYGSSFM